MRVLVVGDLAVVSLFGIEQLPRPGSNLVSESAAVYASGVAANIAWNMRGLVDEVVVVGAVGNDVFGRYIVDVLAARGVHTGSIRWVDAATDMFTILVDGAGERTMIGHRSASACLTLDAAPIAQWAPDWCHISGYTLLNPGALAGFHALVADVARRGIHCSVDLEGIAYTGQHLDLAGLTVFCNWDEYTRYFGRDSASPVEETGGMRLVIKAGADGCFSVDDGIVTPIPAYEAAVVDCTGAGDAFNAAFIAARLRGHNQRDSCAWGNAGAAQKIASAGPRVDLTLPAVQEAVARRHMMPPR